MKTIMVMFDSLNRHFLPPYGCDWTHAPNFARLARRSATFDRSYICSMPCMPARRDLHTGRPSFLHRAWGPLEPFDDSCITRLQNAGVYTHLCSDHYHYWEDGGATYHNRYDTWEFFRGQEGDPYFGQVASPDFPEAIGRHGDQKNRMARQDMVNRAQMRREEQQPQPQTFASGVEFIGRNASQDNWFLQIECFDPHEPFFSPRRYHDLYPEEYSGPHFDWPNYRESNEAPDQIQHLRNRYAALLSMCDKHLGDVLDAMDEHNLWDDTMLIVWTDHGFLLSEHNCWAKNWMPLYEEVSHTPFFVHDPRRPQSDGTRRAALVQPAIDLAPTLLGFFGVEGGPHILGHDLGPVLESDTAVREAAIFGYHGDRINVTDGNHVLYALPATPENGPLYEYTLMPTRMRGYFAPEQLQAATLEPPFAFSQPCPLLRVPGKHGVAHEAGGTRRNLLFDLQADPKQEKPLNDAVTEDALRAHMARLMRECEAPPEQFERMGIGSD